MIKNQTLWTCLSAAFSNQVGPKCHATFDSTRLSEFKFFPGVEELVKKLQAEGRQTIIITNGDATVQRDKLRACDAYSLFTNEKIIVSGGESSFIQRVSHAYHICDTYLCIK